VLFGLHGRGAGESGQEVKVAALVRGQAQRARNSVEDIGRNVDRQALFEAGVPGGPDIRE
jgi:hypothetical protein